MRKDFGEAWNNLSAGDASRDGGNKWKIERGVALLRGLDGFPNVSKHQTEVRLITEASLNTAEFNHRLTY